jgi:hypothetical protein
LIANDTVSNGEIDEDPGGGVGIRVGLRGGDTHDAGGGGNIIVGTIDDGHLEPGEDLHGEDGSILNEDNAGGGGNIVVGKIDDGHLEPGEDLHGEDGSILAEENAGGGGIIVVGTIDDGHLEPGEDLHGEDGSILAEENAGGGGNIADSHKDLGKHFGGGGNDDDGHNRDTQQRGLQGKGGQVSVFGWDSQDTGGGGTIDGGTVDVGHFEPGEGADQDLLDDEIHENQGGGAGVRDDLLVEEDTILPGEGLLEKIMNSIFFLSVNNFTARRQVKPYHVLLKVYLHSYENAETFQF